MTITTRILFLVSSCVLAAAFLPSLVRGATVQLGIYGEYAPKEPIELEGQQDIVTTCIVLLFLLMAFEVSTPEVLFLAALTIVLFCEIVTLPEALSGFSNAAVLTIGSLFIVIAAIERSHVVDWLARQAFGASGSDTLGKLRLYIMCFSLSTFFNNTPLVALLMPIVKDWGRMRGISASQLLMPLSYAVLAGSFGSMIGTSTNLTIQGLMLADRGYEFPFFAPLPIGVACFLCLSLYMLIASPYILPSNQNGLIREARDKTESLVAEIFVSRNAKVVGKSVANMMTSIGLPPSYAIKIRRKVKASSGIGSSDDAFPKAKTSYLDNKYLNRFAGFLRSSTQDTPSETNQGSSYTSVKDTNDATSGVADVEEQIDNYTDIVAPSGHELIAAEDILFVSSAQEVVSKMMKSVLGESEGLHILNSDVMALPGFGTELLECVISDTNPLIGSKVSELPKIFSEKYKLGLITVRPKDWGKVAEPAEGTSAPGVVDNSNSGIKEGGIELLGIRFFGKSRETGNVQEAAALPSESVLAAQISEHLLSCGDAVLCVAGSKDLVAIQRHPDFFVASSVGSLPTPISLFSVIPLALFAIMLVMVALEYIDICPASMLFASLCLVGGWVKPDEIPKVIDLRLLMLLGASLSFSISMTKSGLAAKIAEDILTDGSSLYSSLLLIYIITLIVTEVISNNAAAALMYPIAVGVADAMKEDFRPFAMAVLVASTAGFMSPIGYQTHLMVWGPGGYKFKDFIIFGIVPDFIYMLVGCAVIVELYN